MKQETLYELLHELYKTADRAATAGMVAKRVLGEKLDKTDVEHVLTVMGRHPYFTLFFTESGRVKGLRTNYAAPGVCGERFHRGEPWRTSFWLDGNPFGEAAEAEYKKEAQLRSELQRAAAERGWPYLVFGHVTENIRALVPVLWRQLQDTNTAASD